MSIVYIGSYTEMITEDFGGHGKGIYCLDLNINTGSIKVLNITKTINPSYLCIDQNSGFLYNVCEVVANKKPKIQAYKINNDASLSFINEHYINGSLPCHINYHNNNVYVACYGSGNVLKFTSNKNGELLESNQNYYHKGKSINKLRQEAPHAHQVTIHPTKELLFVPDLGLDQVKVYAIKNHFSPNNKLDIAIPKGCGPRHIVFNKTGSIGYLINELTSEISILKNKNESYFFYKNIKSLPESYTETPSASAIKIHPNQCFLYAGNRTLDAITIFKIIDDDLQLIAYQFTNGKTLRDFNISPDGNWLIACLQDSDETIIYQIEPNGTLIEKFRTTDIASPVCVTFL